MGEDYESRKEKILDSIDETNQFINNISVVVQGLKEVLDKANRLDERIEINKLINKLNNEIDFLEEFKENDEETLRLL